MAPSNKHVLPGRDKSIYSQCRSDKSIQSAFKITQQSSQEKVTTEELEELR